MEIKMDPHSTQYTTKEVEDVNLIHTNKEILVLTTLKISVIDWHHNTLVNWTNSAWKKVYD